MTGLFKREGPIKKEHYQKVRYIQIKCMNINKYIESETFWADKFGRSRSSQNFKNDATQDITKENFLRECWT